MINLKSNIKDKLPYGAIVEIKRRSNVSYLTALNTIQGKSRNAKVLKALKEYLEEKKEIDNLIQEVL